MRCLATQGGTVYPGGEPRPDEILIHAGVSRAKATNRHGEWNTIELICLGGDSIHIVNGHVTMRLSGARRTVRCARLDEGLIGLQSEGAEVFFRNIRGSANLRDPGRSRQSVIKGNLVLTGQELAIRRAITEEFLEVPGVDAVYEKSALVRRGGRTFRPDRGGAAGRAGTRAK